MTERQCRNRYTQDANDGANDREDAGGGAPPAAGVGGVAAAGGVGCGS